jgi:pimeloyl-ACP methyl ester carboxylesterase
MINPRDGPSASGAWQQTLKLELIRQTPDAPSIWPPVLFVHGGFHAAWCWEEHFLPYFAANGFDAVAVSLRGHGLSEGHSGLKNYRLADYVEDVETTAASLHPLPILIGHSIGAVIVEQYLQSRAASAAVLLCPTPTGPLPFEKLKWFLHFPWATFRMIATGNMIHALPSLRGLFFSPEVPAWQVEMYMCRMQNESTQVFTDISRLRRNTPSKTLPTLVVTAQHDVASVRKTRMLVKAFDAELATFPTHHDAMLDPNWQAVASCIVNWLGRNVSPMKGDSIT